MFLGEDGGCEGFGEEVGAPSSKLEYGLGAHNSKKTRDDLRIESWVGESEVSSSIELLYRVGDIALGGHCGRRRDAPKTSRSADEVGFNSVTATLL